MNIFNSLNLKCKDYKLVKRKLRSEYYGIKNRCNNQHDPSYKDYGSRGIKVCEDWTKDPFQFFKWALENGYDYIPLKNNKNQLSLDRIDVNGNYEPNNCRWTSYEVQANNKRNVTKYFVDNNYLSITQLSKIKNIDRKTLKYRVNIGNMNIDEALGLGNFRKGIYKEIIGINKISGEIKKFYKPINASQYLGINHSNIIQCLKGKRKSAGGYIWTYKRYGE